MDAETCEFTVESFKEFTIKYEAALYNKKKSFTFQDKEVLVEYANYIIEYLEPKFKKYAR